MVSVCFFFIDRIDRTFALLDNINHYFSHFSSDSICSLPCVKGEICDEIVGKCVCDPSLRDVEWCRLRKGETILQLVRSSKERRFTYKSNSKLIQPTPSLTCVCYGLYINILVQNVSFGN